MADPTIQTFCCHHRNHSDTAVRLMNEFNKDRYIAVSLVSSLIGIVGALYQIFGRNECNPIDGTESRSARGRRIIVWLAVADLFAAVGIFMRSAMWKYFQSLIPSDDDTTSVIFCAVSSAWTQYFYTCTWLWTLCYAIDIRKTLSGLPVPESRYHNIIWTMAAVLTALGLTVLYVPDADCHDIREYKTALLRVLPNYCITYLPIAVVMIANPYLYRQSCREIRNQLALYNHQITIRERRIMQAFKAKFAFIIIVYYVCWLPNLISGIILWTTWYSVPVKLIIGIWYLMALINPLQAFFNALVYRKWNCNANVDDRTIVPYRCEHINDRTPLLQKINQQFHRNSPERDFPVDSRNSVNACPCL